MAESPLDARQITLCGETREVYRVDRAGHPTADALAQVLAFFHERLPVVSPPP